MAGNKEIRHERLLGVSRLDGRKQGREGKGDGFGIQREKRNLKKKKRRRRGGWMK